MTGAVRLAVVLAMALLAGGCATRRPVQATAQGLTEQGQRELARGRPGPEVAPPPGLDPQRVSPTGDDRSMMTLERAVASLAPERADQQAIVSEDDRREALKRYAAGRLLLRDGDALAATRELTSATALDPTAGEAWVLRGEAELAAGQRAAGARSLGQGVALGAGEAVHRELLARDAIERREYEVAARLLADARTMDPSAEAPELALVIDAQLGVALERLGYDTAARRLLLDVTPALAAAAPAGRLAPLVASAIRQQARYWTLIGDLSCRLGDYPGAFEAYRQASLAPGADSASLAKARIYAALRAGAPSHAAAIALAAVEEAGLVDGAGAALLSYVAEADDRAADSLRRALAARLSETPADDSARVTVAVALAALQPAPEARRTLLAAHASSPHNPELIRAVARSAADAPAHEASRLGAQMVRAAPMKSAVIALALLRAHRETNAIIESALGSDDPASRLLAARALALAGRPADGLAALGGRAAADPGLDQAMLAARAQLAADAGGWNEVESAVASLRSVSDAHGRWALALALAAAQRYGEALESLTPLLDDDPPVGALVDGAWLARGLGERALALRWLERALERDPRNEAAHELRLRLVNELQSRAEAQRLASEAVADLRAHLPASDLLELIEVGALIGRGRYRDAQKMVLALAADPLRADEALRTGVEGIWSRRSPRGPDRELLEEARQWLAERAPQRPQSPATARALAATLVAQGRAEEAAEALREAIERYPWPELSVALEVLLRQELNRAEEADLLALRRLEGGPAGIDEILALAALRARRGELAEAAAAAARVPEGVHLTDDQTRLLVEAARVAGVAAEEGASDGFPHAAALFDAAERLGVEAGFEFHEARVQMLCAWPQAGPQRLAGALRHASARLGEESSRLPALMAQWLEQQERGDDALAVFLTLAEGDEAMPRGAQLAWIVTVARVGNAADARRVLETGRRAGTLCTLLQQLWPEISPPPDTSQIDCALVLVSELARQWHPQQRHDDMVGLFRYAYELRPDDPGSANDLGYTLLEARQDLDEAARLIERAYREEPENGAILDSIGWLRYRQGIFEDELDEAGNVMREGAVTLLERAKARRQSPTVHDHLGDALWRIGRPAAARLEWQTARGLAARDEGGQEQTQAISQKLRAALRGEEPQVAEVYEELQDARARPAPSAGAGQTGER